MIGKFIAPITLALFLKSNTFVRFVVGPVGSGKSSGCCVEVVRRACEQAPGTDGVRRTRFAIIRNTYSQLRDTTRKTFEQWIDWLPEVCRVWHEQSFTLTLMFPLADGTKVHCEVLFRALDRPEDIRKLLSLELTGAYINEVREVPKHVLDVLETRVGRYPSKAQGGASWFGIWADSNPWHGGHWAAKLFAKLRKEDGYELFRQPGGRSEQAENIENLPPGYYDRLVVGKSADYVRIYVDGLDGDSDQGAVFGHWMAALRERGGVQAFDHPKDAIFTAWDLGRADATAIWFWRYDANRWPQVVDFYENTNEGVSHYFRVLRERGYRYARHFLPHDARAKTLATQQSVLEQCVAEFGADHVGIVPSLSIADGIEAARWLLEQPITFHERCDQPGLLEHSGLDALQEYRYEWDEENLCFSKAPIHNWASHAADAFRQLAVVVRFVEKITRPPTPENPPPGPKPLDRGTTFDQLLADRLRARRG